MTLQAETASTRGASLDSIPTDLGRRVVGLGILPFALLITSGGAAAQNGGRLCGYDAPSRAGIIPFHDRRSIIMAPTTLRSLTQAPVDSTLSAKAKDLVQSLHDESGLTWEQLAKLFGVSRRALHLWVAGGRLNSANQQVLTTLIDAVRSLPGGTPGAKRSQLMAPRGGRRSLFDELRAMQGSTDMDVNRPAAPIQSLLGHDVVTTG